MIIPGKPAEVDFRSDEMKVLNGVHIAGMAVLATVLAMSATAQAPREASGQPAPDYNVSKRSAADIALPNPYARNETFFHWPAGRKLGAISAIDIDKDGKSVWVVERCGGQDNCIGSHVNPIVEFDQNGKVVRQFGADMIVYPHGMYVDRDGNIWATDLQSNVDRPPPRPGQTPEVVPTDRKPNGAQVLKFSPDGKLLLRIGIPGVYGNDATHLSQPSDVVTAPNGDIFIADGHDSAPSNHRIAKYDKNGKFIRAWDACGRAPVEGANVLDCQHSIAIDSQGRLFVANRGNNRIEVFDQDGKLLDEWYQFGKPSGLFIDKNDILYAGDTESSVRQGNAYVRGIHVGSARTGQVTAFIPDVLGNPTPWFPLRGTTGSEGVAATADGILYSSQVMPAGLNKYTKKPE
jgi:sugar lactone lactonase YvrE